MKLIDFPKIQTCMKRAFNASKRSNYQKYMIGAVIEKNGKPISIGWSQEKTHPFTNQHGTYSKNNCVHIGKNIHAEISAIFRVKNRESLIGAAIYIYRQNKDGNLAMSRPCPMCYKMIKECGFKKMIFTTDGGIEEELLKG